MTGSVLLVQSTAERYGSDRAAHGLAARLPAHGWAVTVAVPGPGPLVDDLQAVGARVEIADPGVVRRVTTPAGWARFALVDLPAAVLRYRRLARSFDLVHVNTSVSIGALIGARLARRPVVVHLRESYRGSERAFGAYAWLLRRLGAHVVAISTGVLAEAAAAGLAGRTVLVHDGIEPPTAAPPEPPPMRWDVVCVSRINDWKGLDVLVDAVAELRARGTDVRVAIAGDVFPGGERHRLALDARIADRGVGDLVTLLGFVDDVSSLLRSSLVFVLPSTRPEPFGLALVEAMAHGLAVVASAAGGPVDIVEPGVTGVLVPPGDSTALADELESLLRDDERRSRLGSCAAAVALERFSVDAAAHAVAQLYQQVIGTGTGGARRS